MPLARARSLLGVLGVAALGATTGALTAVILLGCASPIVRALRIAPAEALRRE